MSHADYFEKKKGIALRHPSAAPLVAVLGRNNSTIYLPAELVCGNELEPKLRMQLPQIASFTPEIRHEGIEEMKRYLTPGAQKTKGAGGGLLPALGVVLGEERVRVDVNCLTLPRIMAAGIQVPESRGGMWAPILNQARFNVSPGRAVELNVVVVYHRDLSRSFNNVYSRITDMVNKFSAAYRFAARPYAVVEAGDLDDHWGAVQRYFSNSKLPENVFVLDFTRPPRRSSTDPAYSAVKHMLGKAGYLSQFINFNTYDHGQPRDFKKSNTILQGVSRQILSKCGVRVWWVSVPRSLPLPAVFVGVDVFHAPRKYDPKEKKRTAKESCAAVIVQLIRSADQSEYPTIELYSETERRQAGQEMELGSVMNRAVSNALKHFNVSPMSCIVWRDGVGDAAIDDVAKDEISGVRDALANMNIADGGGSRMSSEASLAYIVCQKRIATKFLTADGSQGMPAGALIKSLHSARHDAFYINGTSPPYSTPKPVRFVIAKKDRELDDTDMSELSWALCHDYPNWTGPIKLPAPVQMAHKLAELAGGFPDCGDSLNSHKFANSVHFL